jgi:hypothetical protein
VVVAGTILYKKLGIASEIYVKNCKRGISCRTCEIIFCRYIARSFVSDQPLLALATAAAV